MTDRTPVRIMFLCTDPLPATQRRARSVLHTGSLPPDCQASVRQMSTNCPESVQFVSSKCPANVQYLTASSYEIGQMRQFQQVFFGDPGGGLDESPAGGRPARGLAPTRKMPLRDWSRAGSRTRASISRTPPRTTAGSSARSGSSERSRGSGSLMWTRFSSAPRLYHRG